MPINKMMKDEFLNIMAQNGPELEEDLDVKDCFIEGLIIMGKYLGTVHVEFREGVVWTERVEKLLAHNIQPEDIERLHALGWFVEYEYSTMVVFEL